MDPSRRPRVILFFWLFYWLGLFVATHIPMLEGPPRIRHGDKVLHFVAYFGLAALGGWRLDAVRRPRLLGALWLWAVVYIVYGAVDEALQLFVGRSMTVGDWIADAAGVATATLLWGWVGRRRLSELRT